MLLVYCTDCTECTVEFNFAIENFSLRCKVQLCQKRQSLTQMALLNHVKINRVESTTFPGCLRFPSLHGIMLAKLNHFDHLTTFFRGDSLSRGTVFPHSLTPSLTHSLTKVPINNPSYLYIY